MEREGYREHDENEAGYIFIQINLALGGGPLNQGRVPPAVGPGIC